MEKDDYPLDAMAAARRAQRRVGWSDRMLLAQCIAHMWTYSGRLYDRDRFAAVADGFDDLPAHAPDVDRVAVITSHLEVCFGYFGSEWLEGALERQRAMTEDQAETLIAGFPTRSPNGPVADPRIARDRARRTPEQRRAQRRQALLIVAGTGAVFLAIFVAVFVASFVTS